MVPSKKNAMSGTDDISSLFVFLLPLNSLFLFCISSFSTRSWNVSIQSVLRPRPSFRTEILATRLPHFDCLRWDTLRSPAKEVETSELVNASSFHNIGQPDM